MSKQSESETVNKTVYTMEDIFGPVKTREEVMRLIEADPGSKKNWARRKRCRRSWMAS